ncbi:MAG: hypothetical protein K2F57_04605, partial [Candidatus Gastranaerophilales bacterium]|nr:hypothetical protein [Candidatus Gastranaerophilales bacterium]
MSGVELRNIADYQAAIQKLDRKNPEDLKKIKEYTAKIGELLKNEGKVEVPENRGELNISEEMGFTYNGKIAGQEKIDDLNQYNKKSVGKDQARQNVKDKFGAGALDNDEYKAKKNELKAEEKELKQLNKQLGKLKFDKANPEAYNTARNELNDKIREQSAKVAQLQKEMVDIEATRTGNSNKFAKKYEKAARQNVEQYEKTQDVVETFLDKAEAKAWEKENPGQKAAVINENDLRALTTLYYKGVDEIKKAEESGDDIAIKAAHDKYDDYVGIFEKDDQGKPQFNKVNTRNVQNILVDKSGGDQNFNLDEVDVMSKDLGMKKGQIKHLVKEFGFGTESQ